MEARVLKSVENKERPFFKKKIVMLPFTQCIVWKLIELNTSTLNLINDIIIN